MSAADLVHELGLEAHPEGGWYAEIFRSELKIKPEAFPGERNALTSIYFLLESGQFSALHRIKSDEIWHFYEGGPLEVIEIDHSGVSKITLLGRNLKGGAVLCYTVKAGNWFGSRPAPGTEYSLVGCTVAPGFDFEDFEMPDQEWFLTEFPGQSELIMQITRPGQNG
jgi:predicted cupin superfamily sugar epimerase